MLKHQTFNKATSKYTEKHNKLTTRWSKGLTDSDTTNVTTTTTTTTTTVVVGATTPLTPSIRIQIPITPFSSPCSAPPPSVSSATSSLPNSQRPKLCLLPPPPTPHFSPNLFMKSKAASGPNSFLTPPTTSLSPHNRDSCRSYHLSNLHSWQPSCGSSAATSSRA